MSGCARDDEAVSAGAASPVCDGKKTMARVAVGDVGWLCRLCGSRGAELLPHGVPTFFMEVRCLRDVEVGAKRRQSVCIM